MGNIYSYTYNNEGMVTYVSDTSYLSSKILKYAYYGARDGMSDNSNFDDDDGDKNPTGEDFNDYLDNYEYVFFAGHGMWDGFAIGSDEDNGFTNTDITGWFSSNDFDSTLNSKVFTIMACDGLKNSNSIGYQANNEGVKCSVGWDDTLIMSKSEAYDWAYYFYECSDLTYVPVCIDYATEQSNLEGAEYYGFCADYNRENNIHSNSSTNNRVYTLDNGFIEFYPDINVQSLRTSLVYSNEFFKDEIITYAKEILDSPKNYKFVEFTESENFYRVSFARYYNDVEVNFDKYSISLDKNLNVNMIRKTFTDNLNIETNLNLNSSTLNKKFEGFQFKDKKIFKIKDDIILGFLISNGKESVYIDKNFKLI